MSTGMSNYEARKAARIERYQAAAERLRAEGAARYQTARTQLEMIPMGQPILIGHHSEKGHRAHLKRIDNNMRKSIEASDGAKELERRAEAAESNRAISSDDPSAPDKIRAKIEGLERLQQCMKDANAAIRKHKKAGAEAQVAALIAQGIDSTKAYSLLVPDFCGRVGFPSYATTNNNANIRRLKQRLEHLEKLAEVETKEVVLDAVPDVQIIQNAEENRTQIFFPGKPSETIRKALKSKGFRWSPYNACWQRHLSEWALEEAKDAVLYYQSEKETGHAV